MRIKLLKRRTPWKTGCGHQGNIDVGQLQPMTDTWDFRRRASGIGRTRRTYIKAAQWFRAEHQILRESTG